MNPALEHFIVAAIVGGAVSFFVVRFFRQRSDRKKGCGSDCGCGVKSKAK